MLCLVGIVLVSVLNFGARVSASADWNYKHQGTKGPQHWAEHYPDCGGVMQSPIDINTDIALYDRNLPFLDISEYFHTDRVKLRLENVGGHTAQVHVTGPPIYLKGGNLPAPYKLVQFHFHWGRNDSRGSEHSRDSHFSAGEVHFVHIQNRYANVSEAANKPFGLAVLSFFLKVVKRNPNFETLLSHTHQIEKPDTGVDLPTFAIGSLIPSRQFYYFRYMGSLTTPPCSESVIWTVSDRAIELSHEQMEALRSLEDDEHNKMVDDFRPIMPLHQRTITTNQNLQVFR